jgi:hypothetical protein
MIAQSDLARNEAFAASLGLSAPAIATGLRTFKNRPLSAIGVIR